MAPFPGEFAGASLKPRGASAGDPADHPPFPGEFAGASLKPLDLFCGGGGAARAFPGEFAGASLKLVERADIFELPHAIPRRIRRGLIEMVPSG